MGLALIACPGNSPTDENNDPTDTPIGAVDLTDLVPAPVRDTLPTITITQPQYTGTISWAVTDGAILAAGSNFVPATAYTATVALTAKTGYTFDGFAANSVIYRGTGTPTPNEAGSGDVTIAFPLTADEGADTPVNSLVLTTLITAPAVNGTPTTTVGTHTQYTGTITWKTANEDAVSGTFGTGVAYTATVNLKANTGYTFTGVAANSFIYSGATSINEAGDGDEITVTITFPATGTPVNALNLSSLITAPVVTGTPTTAEINRDQYTGTIAWQTAAGAPVTTGSTFAAATVYKAVVTLTAKPGYTFTGVAANSFTHTGASAITNPANSGTVTITFPPTASENTPASSPIPTDSVQVYDEDGSTASTVNGTVKMAVYDSTEEPTYIPVGTITNGKLTLTLPATIDAQYLSTFDPEEMGIPDITVNPSTINVLPGVTLQLFNGEEEIGYLSYEKEGNNKDEYREIEYWYFDKPGTAIGTQQAGESGTITVNITVPHAGWIPIQVIETETENSWTTTTTTTIDNLSGYQWILSRYWIPESPENN
jgi:hypothetical protein